MATLKLSLYPRPNKQGKHSIVLAVIHKRKQVYIVLPVEPVLKTDLITYENGIAEISKKATYYNNRTWTNNFLLHEKERTEKIILELTEKNEINSLSIKQLSDAIRLKQKKSDVLVLDYVNNIAQNRLNLNKINTSLCYLNIASSINSYCPTLHFEEIDFYFLKKYESWLRTKNISGNSINSMFDYLKAAYRCAVIDRIIEDKKPFTDIRIKKEKVQKRALNMFFINQIIDYKPINKKEEIAKDVFLFSFYNAGINVNDIVRLTTENINNGRLRYYRGKTHDFFNFKLNDESLAILDKYKDAKPYLFPIIQKKKFLTILELERHILCRKSTLNYTIVNIGEKLNLPIRLTAYVARHSFATLAKNRNIPIHAISQLLGHEDIKTTSVYLKDLNTDELDVYMTEIYK
jgi:site-specific recombinase XerD